MLDPQRGGIGHFGKGRTLKEEGNWVRTCQYENKNQQRILKEGGMMTFFIICWRKRIDDQLKSNSNALEFPEFSQHLRMN
jgi:hypothetical protein